MVDFDITSDKSTYRAGESARLEVTADWGDPEQRGSTDLWAFVTVEFGSADGKWILPEVFPEFPMHELDPEQPLDMGWMCYAVRRGREGHRRATATIFEPERQEVAKVSCEFDVAEAE